MSRHNRRPNTPRDTDSNVCRSKFAVQPFTFVPEARVLQLQCAVAVDEPKITLRDSVQAVKSMGDFLSQNMTYFGEKVKTAGVSATLMQCQHSTPVRPSVQQKLHFIHLVERQRQSS